MRPKVSVCVTTFNHEPYIRECLDSILTPDVTFPVEIVVAEDGVTRRTRKLVRGVAARHPQVRPLFRETNLGANRNFADALLHCRGEFVAVLDGDDFWTSPHKLSRQVAFMETHPELMMSGHLHRIVTWHPDGTSAARLSPRVERRLTLKDILRGHYIGSCTMMFRREILPESMPEWFFATPSGDWCLEFLAARKGPIGFFNEIMADYRVHAGGVWRGESAENHCRWQLELLDEFRKSTPASEHAIIDAAQGDLHTELAWYYAEAGDLPKGREHLRRAVSLLPLRRRWRPAVLRTRLHLQFPAVYRGVRRALRGTGG